MSPVALPSQHAAVLYGPKDLHYEERPLWQPRQGEAQVAIVATGLCGSDRVYIYILLFRIISSCGQTLTLFI